MVNKLDSKIEKKLLKTVSSSNFNIKNFKYEISDDGKFINLSGIMENPDFELLSTLIDKYEKLLNAKFVNVSSVSGTHTFTYEFI